MSVVTIEGEVKNGQIYLPNDVRLPDGAKVYILIPDYSEETVTVSLPASVARLQSPRLLNPQDALRLRKVIVEETDDANV